VPLIVPRGKGPLPEEDWRLPKDSFARACERYAWGFAMSRKRQNFDNSAVSAENVTFNSWLPSAPSLESRGQNQTHQNGRSGVLIQVYFV